MVVFGIPIFAYLGYFKCPHPPHVTRAEQSSILNDRIHLLKNMDVSIWHIISCKQRVFNRSRASPPTQIQPDGTNLCLGWLKWRDGPCCLHPGVQRRRFVIHEAHCRPASSDEVFSLTYRLRRESRKQLVFVNLHNRTTAALTVRITWRASRSRTGPFPSLSLSLGSKVE